MKKPVEKLPVRKPTSPIAKIVCWRCKRSGVTLLNVKEESGKKTKDYICTDCKKWGGTPPIGNQSLIYYQYAKEE